MHLFPLIVPAHRGWLGQPLGQWCPGPRPAPSLWRSHACQGHALPSLPQPRQQCETHTGRHLRRDCLSPFFLWSPTGAPQFRWVSSPSRAVAAATEPVLCCPIQGTPPAPGRGGSRALEVQAQPAAPPSGPIIRPLGVCVSRWVGCPLLTASQECSVLGALRQTQAWRTPSPRRHLSLSSHEGRVSFSEVQLVTVVISLSHIF